jgi:hypothetical protein
MKLHDSIVQIIPGDKRGETQLKLRNPRLSRSYSGFFASVLPIAIIERLFSTAIGIAIAAPLILMVRQLYLELS